MKFELILFERGDAPADLKATVVCAHDSREVVEKFIERGKTAPGAPPVFQTTAPVRPGPKGRAVVVTAAEEDNGLSYRTGDTFPTAMAASVALGFGYNAISPLLAQAGRKGERSVEVMGLTLSYVENLRD